MARWSATFSSASVSMQVEYWLGNNFVSVKRGDNNLFASLHNLHKSTGVGMTWILLANTLAGSIILLLITCIMLWTLLNRRCLVGASIALTSLVLAIALAVDSI